MSEKFFAPEMSKETVDAHLQDHIRASRAVEERRKQEVEAVLGRVPTFAECEAARKKRKLEEGKKKE